MIDLHCHMLPGIDDGAKDLPTALAMAKMAVADGTQITYCTPHIYPGLYENRGPDIVHRVSEFQRELQESNIPLRLHYGADVHLVPDLLQRIRSGDVPTLGGTCYLLLEPAHTVRPPRFVDTVFELIGHGIVPVITHPERLTWVDDHYDEFLQLARAGAWLQVTAGALLGTFGRGPKVFADRIVGDGWCAVLASDGHTTGRRAPVLSDALHRARQLVGDKEAIRLVMDRPKAVYDNAAPNQVVAPPALHGGLPGDNASILRRIGQWFR